MAKIAENILKNLEALEVSLVPKAANKKRYYLLKSEENTDVLKAETKHENGKDFRASDYAYVPDRSKPSTWKLRLTNTPGGSPDPRIVGAAVAALGKGFRGQKVQIPSGDLARVKAKVRSAYRKANPEKELPEILKSDEDLDGFNLDAEILKAELDEALEAPLTNEDVFDSLVEKEEVTPRGAQALKGIAKIWKQFKSDLPEHMLGTFSELIGFGVQGNQLTQTPVSKETETQEEKTMPENVVKDEQAVETSVSSEEEISKAKKADMEEEEEPEDGKKKPPFMKGKKMMKSDSESEEASLDSLPDNIRKQVEEIFKSNEEIRKDNEKIRKANEEILKAQEATKKQLDTERDIRYTNEHIAKAEKLYSALPVSAKELGPVLKAAEENLSKEHFELIERVLKAADEAMQKSVDFEEIGVTTVSNSTAYGKLDAIAKSLVEKSEKPMTYAQAFTRALNQNPELYDEYTRERA